MKNQGFKQQYVEPIELGVLRYVGLWAMPSAFCPLDDELFGMPSLEAPAFLEEYGIRNTEYVGEESG